MKHFRLMVVVALACALAAMPLSGIATAEGPADNAALALPSGCGATNWASGGSGSIVATFSFGTMVSCPSQYAVTAQSWVSGFGGSAVGVPGAGFGFANSFGIAAVADQFCYTVSGVVTAGTSTYFPPPVTYCV